jgi:RNA recognition motif-containing protein
MRTRGGLARGGARQAIARPKLSNQQKTIRIVDRNAKQISRQKSWAPSDKRLKVRNFDDKQVTNEDLKKLFAKIGDIKICKFDRNEFGQFLGSATVTYERAEDAKQAIREYNGAFLDEKVLVVEHDMVIDK